LPPRQEEGERWLKEHPAEAQELLDILTDVVIDYMSAQAEEGADMLQVFEAMGMFISKESFYKCAMPPIIHPTGARRTHISPPASCEPDAHLSPRRYAMPCMAKIAAELHKRHPTVPLMAFPRGATYSLADLQQAGYDVVPPPPLGGGTFSAPLVASPRSAGSLRAGVLAPKRGSLREGVLDLLESAGSLREGVLPPKRTCSEALNAKAGSRRGRALGRARRVTPRGVLCR
jgi:uroporphyrinogen-III decarboxylase